MGGSGGAVEDKKSTALFKLSLKCGHILAKRIMPNQACQPATYLKIMFSLYTRIYRKITEHNCNTIVVSAY